MLRHTGTRRTFSHNLRLAILLSTTAGFVNAAGLVAFAVLTTNITGHAAELAVSSSTGDWRMAKLGALGVLLFLAGAFFSSWYIETMGRHRRFVYSVPLLLELLVLVYIAFYGHGFEEGSAVPEHYAGALLFVMGMQNALVSVVSRSVVRTTHLTGMVTDFGIALAELVRKKLKPSVSLRQRLTLHVSIIFFFLLGGYVGAMAMTNMSYHSFLLPAGLILFTLLYDVFRMRILLIRRQYYLLQRRRKRYRLRRQRRLKTSAPKSER